MFFALLRGVGVLSGVLRGVFASSVKLLLFRRTGVAVVAKFSTTSATVSGFGVSRDFCEALLVSGILISVKVARAVILRARNVLQRREHESMVRFHCGSET